MNPSYFLTAPWALAIGMTGACIWILVKVKRAGDQAERDARELMERAHRMCEFCDDEINGKWRARYGRTMCYFCYSMKYTLAEVDSQVKDK